MVADAIVFALIVDLFLYSNAASGCKQLKHDKNILIDNKMLSILNLKQISELISDIIKWCQMQ